MSLLFAGVGGWVGGWVCGFLPMKLQYFKLRYAILGWVGGCVSLIRVALRMHSSTQVPVLEVLPLFICRTKRYGC